MLAEQARGAVDEQRVVRRVGQRGEGRRQEGQERALGRPQRRVVQARVQQARPEAHAGQALVEVLPGPRGQARVDRAVEGEHALAHAAGGGDDDDHQHPRLQQEHLDVAHRGRVDRRGGDDRQQVGDLRQRLGRHAHRLVDLAAHERRGPARGRRRARAAAGRRRSGGRRRSAPGPSSCAGGPAARAPRARRARCGSSRARSRARGRRRASSTRPAARSRCAARRACEG